jgi:IS4 transposase
LTVEKASGAKGLTKEEFLSLPQTLRVREVHYYIVIPGFRTKQVSLITTLLNAKAYSTLELVKLYEKRWDVELDLKHLKTSLVFSARGLLFC